MKRVVAVLLVMIALSPAIKAEPKKFIGLDGKTWATVGVVIGSAVFHGIATRNCRERAGVEHCYGGYGERKMMEGLQVGMQGSMLALSLWGKHDKQPGWWVPAIGSATFWTVNGIIQTQRTGRPEIDEAHKAALSYRLK